MKKQKVINCIIDTDPGVDDAAALALSLFDEVMDIKLITTVCGNRDIKTVTRNVLHILEKFKRTDIPVAVGAEKAMKRISPDARDVHKMDGMGGYIPPKTVKTKPIEMDAVEAMYQVIMAHPKDISIILLGPHTNLGNLLVKYPEVKDKISHIYTEGCAAYGHKIEGDRWRSYISFNASSDPEAVDIMLKSGIPVTYIPSRMGRELSNFNEKQIMDMRDINDTGRFLHEMYAGYWEHNYEDRRVATNDTCAVLILRFPYMFKTKRAVMKINTTDAPGKTDIEFNKNGHVEYAYKVNRKSFHKHFFDAIKKMDRFKFYKDNK